MKAYQYNKITGEYVGEAERQIDPLESKKSGKKEYTMPGSCTDKKPSLSVKKNEVSVFKDGNWVIEKDFRGVYYRTDTKEKVVIKNIGEEPDGMTADVPGIYDIWSGGKWVEDSDAKELAEKNKATRSIIMEEMQQMAIEKLIDDGTLKQSDIDSL